MMNGFIGSRQHVKQSKNSSKLRTGARQSRHAAPNGPEIRLAGRPVLALNPATNDLLGVAEFNGHPLVAGRYFYSLPPMLWKSILAKVGTKHFDAETLRMEQAMSSVCQDHSTRVGIWQSRFVEYQGLHPIPAPTFTDEHIRACEMEPLEVRNSLRLFGERDAVPFERFRRSYVGWLLTNREFLNEHDSLLADHAETVRRWGTHLAGVFVPSGILSQGMDPTGESSWQSFNTSCKEFFTRWRLQCLAGPYLPVPLQALMAGLFPWTVVEQLMRAGGVFFLPDTMPIFSRDELRGLLDHALHKRQTAEHLSGWFHIIRASSGARNQLDRFGRLFEIQHYWRILRQRHAGALAGNIGRMELAFSQFFKTSNPSIHADLIAIRRRLGAEWAKRPWPV
jgi:hypothetical protein